MAPKGKGIDLESQRIILKKVGLTPGLQTKGGRIITNFILESIAIPCKTV